MVMRGTTTRISSTFYDGPGGELVDPTSLTLEIRFEDDVILTAPSLEIVRDSLGQFHYDWDIDDAAPVGGYVAVWAAVLPGDTLPSYGYDNINVTSTPPGLPGFSGCIWPIDVGCLGDTWDTYSEEVQQRAVTLASASMTKLTAGRVGDCPVKVRPDVQGQRCGFIGGAPWAWGPTFYGSAYGDLYGVLGGDPRDITLPGPVNRIDEVMIDGVALNAADYRISDRAGGRIRYLGTDLEGWPVTQDWNVEADEAGAFTITYLNTAAVDSQGANAAGLLAAEFAKACASTDPKVKCKFPSNITSIVRQGMQIEFVAGSFPNGMTGIREVDLYTAQWNVKGRSPATLIDTGAPAHQVVTR